MCLKEVFLSMRGRLPMTYNEKRKAPDRCSSCGTEIGLGHKPRLCSNCTERQARCRSNRKPKPKKGLPVTHKLKTYKIPTEPWKYFLYTKYKEIGLNSLAHEIGVPSRTLMSHIFTKTKPIGKNYKAIHEYFRKYERNDLVAELQKYEL